MAVTATAVSVTTTATRLDTVTETDRSTGCSVVVFNNAAAAVFLGGSGVTTSTGLSVAAGGTSVRVDLQPDEGLFGIVASGTADVRVLETGV